MSFALSNLIVSAAVSACVTVLAVRTLVSLNGSLSAWLIAAICVAVLCNQVLSWQEFAPFQPPSLRFDTGRLAPILNLIRNTAPGLFMIQAHRLFVDGERFPRWLLAAFGLQLGLEVIAFAAPMSGVLEAGPAALELMFGGLALYWTLASWPADLVENRRRARAVVLVIVGVNMIAPTLLLRLVTLPGAWSFYVNTLISGLTFIVAAALLVLDGVTDAALVGGRTSAAPAVALTPSADDDEAALERLQRRIAVDQVYLEPDLKLSVLAQRVGVPEYRLRRVIHTRLGHRNFNAFLHSLRIAEACRRLQDQESRRTPILTIALSVGYGSVNTFNRGFRDIMNCSPSEYRAGSETGKIAPEAEISHPILKSAEA